MRTNLEHEDRCIGCLLGVACGDILGAGLEGMAASEIRDEYEVLRDFLDTMRGFGCYTNDTQMTLALATSLVECGRVDAARVSAKYAEFYEPWRGYGGAAHRVMRLLRDGGDYRGTGTLEFPEGSFGNGSAMRIAPVGLAYRNADDESLAEAVEDAILCTHVHPEAIDGALAQAKAVAIASTADAASLAPFSIMESLLTVCTTEAMQLNLRKVADGLRHGDEDFYVIGRVGNGIRHRSGGGSALGVPSSRNATGRMRYPRRKLRRRHRYHRRHGRRPGRRTSWPRVDSSTLVRQHRKQRAGTQWNRFSCSTVGRVTPCLGCTPAQV